MKHMKRALGRMLEFLCKNGIIDMRYGKGGEELFGLSESFVDCFNQTLKELEEEDPSLKGVIVKALMVSIVKKTGEMGKGDLIKATEVILSLCAAGVEKNPNSLYEKILSGVGQEC
jgi:hypothetical protein